MNRLARVGIGKDAYLGNMTLQVEGRYQGSLSRLEHQPAPCRSQVICFGGRAGTKKMLTWIRRADIFPPSQLN